MKTILKSTIAAFATSVLFLSELQAIGCWNPCYPTACDTNNSCCCDGPFWVDGEYLYWQMKDSPKLIPLATQGTNSVPALGTAGTEIVLGDKKVKNDWRSGAKFSAGYWIDDCHTWGIEGSYFFLSDNTKKHSVSNTGEPGTGFLAVPYIDARTGTETAYRVSNSSLDVDSGPYSGFAEYNLRNKILGAELNGAMLFLDGCDYKIGVLAGFRWFNLTERFTFGTSSPSLGFVDDVYVTHDKFKTINNFYGGQIGACFAYNCNCFFVDLKAKVALGTTCGKVNVHGHLKTNDFLTPAREGTPVTYNGGIFALPTNEGSHRQSFFTVIPEVNLNVGYQIADCLRFKIGYSFLYANKVLRATNQLDRHLNPTQSTVLSNNTTPVLTGVARPEHRHRTESFWAQGLNVGFEFNF